MIKVATLVFNPFTNDSRVLKEALSLAKNNYSVTVVAHGDEGLATKETIDNIEVVRVAFLNRKVTKKKLLKVKAYLSYIKEAVNYSKEFDILHCNDLNSLPIAVIIKKFYNKDIKIVYDAHEYETEMKGLSGVTKALTKFFEKNMIKYADKTITVSNSIANEYARLYNIEKPNLVLNAPPYKKIEKKDIFREKFNISKEKTIFLYQGGLSGGRGIEIILEAFTDIDEKSVIVFMGYGPLEELVNEYADKYENIYYHDAVTPDVLLDYTCSADFGILFYENNCLNHYYCSPNKMFEYLMAEISVISSNLYEMKKIVEENNIGVVATDNSANGLREAIVKATQLDYETLKTNIKKVNLIYNWEEQEKVLLETYKELDK